MTTEFIISGHSENTKSTFVVPTNVTLVFYANENEKCIVTSSKKGLDFAVNFMRSIKNTNSPNVKGPNSIAKNYMISGFNKREYMHVYRIVNANNINSYSIPPTFEEISETTEIPLETLCNRLRMVTRDNIIIYCSFCRGSEEGDDRGIFEADTAALDIVPHDMDLGTFNEPPLQKRLRNDEEDEETNQNKKQKQFEGNNYGYDYDYDYDYDDAEFLHNALFDEDENENKNGGKRRNKTNKYRRNKSNKHRRNKSNKHKHNKTNKRRHNKSNKRNKK